MEEDYKYLNTPYVKLLKLTHCNDEFVCDACRELASRLIPKEEAPDLPYAGCTSEMGCRCSYGAAFLKQPKQLREERTARTRAKLAASRGLSNPQENPMKKQKTTSQKFWGCMIWVQIIGLILFLIFIAFVVVAIMSN